MRTAGGYPARLLNLDWRFVVLAGGSAGLLGASLVHPAPFPSGWPLLLVAIGLALTLIRPDRSRGLWLTSLAAAAALGGLAAGADRLAAIDRGAVPVTETQPAAVRGFVSGVPRRNRGVVSFRIEGGSGKLLVRSRRDIPELSVGREVAVEGTIGPPEPWRRASLRRHGILATLDAEQLELTGRRRGGVVGELDQVRDRAEAALERGMAPPEAALARGFVLGQDDRIDPRTVEDFKRSGLAHLLAVSGQNVLLLALLAIPFLAALGLHLRARLIAVLLLIAIYVPVAGAGASIQRAGVMGAAGIVATLAGRPSSRVYAVLLAAFVTLAVNPRAGGDVGWQLSFAAVIGILLWSAPVRDWVLRRLRAGGSEVSPARRVFAEGVGMTVSATVATAPLMGLHFDSVPIAALPANLLALPAVAPVMWLGMIVAAAGQLPGFPVEPINAVNGVLVGYIAQVARWLATPDWALLSVPISGPAAVALAYGAMLGVVAVLRGARRRRGGLVVSRGVAVGVGASVLLVSAAFVMPGGNRGAAQTSTGLAVTVLDVGQGDAILLDPPRGNPILVDTGPPSAELWRWLSDAGIERLAALVITHDQLDHAGAAADVLGRFEVDAVVHAAAVPSLDGLRDQPRRVQIAGGDTLRSGRLELEALWPPPELINGGRSPTGRPQTGGLPPGGPAAASVSAQGLDDPNRLSLVLIARWRDFSMLLTGDAEAEAVDIDPGPIDVLKVAHHGSEDRGLAQLLASSGPAAAVISVGSGNRHGHPAEETVSALARAGVRTFRTDRTGDATIVVDSDHWEIHTGSD